MPGPHRVKAKDVSFDRLCLCPAHDKERQSNIELHAKNIELHAKNIEVNANFVKERQSNIELNARLNAMAQEVAHMDALLWQAEVTIENLCRMFNNQM